MTTAYNRNMTKVEAMASLSPFLELTARHDCHTAELALRDQDAEIGRLLAHSTRLAILLQHQTTTIAGLRAEVERLRAAGPTPVECLLRALRPAQSHGGTR